MPLRGINRRAKGNRGEYAVRDILRGFGYKANRMPMSGAIETLKGDISSDFPFFLEVKNTKTTQFQAWYEKASQESGAKPPMVVWVNEGRIYAFADLSDLIRHAQGGLSQPVERPRKAQKASLDDTQGFMYSKKYQTRRPSKTAP